MAIGSTVADAVLARDEPIVVNHHNLTPMRYIAGWQPVAAHGVAWGRGQLRELAARARLGVADSSYNENDLIEAGFTRTTVVPILFDLGTLDARPAPSPHDGRGHLALRRSARPEQGPARHRQGVRRLPPVPRRRRPPAPRRRRTRRRLRPDARRFIHALGLDDAVTLAGGVSPRRARRVLPRRRRVRRVQRARRLLRSAPRSDALRRPIVAYASTAVPETLGEAGLLLDVKDPCTIAAAVDRVAGDAALRRQLVAAGARRVPGLRPLAHRPAFVEAMTSAASADRPT